MAEKMTNPRLTANDVYYLHSILGMLKSAQMWVKHGPTLYTEALGDNLDWLENFIDSQEQVFTVEEIRKRLLDAADSGIGSYTMLHETMGYFKAKAAP